MWLDFLRFEDQVDEGRPVRMGLGRTQPTVSGPHNIAGGMELSFHPAEVFDVTDKRVQHQGIYVPLASAG